jgi:hypothetical protein
MEQTALITTGPMAGTTYKGAGALRQAREDGKAFVAFFTVAMFVDGKRSDITFGADGIIRYTVEV